MNEVVALSLIGLEILLFIIGKIRLMYEVKKIDGFQGMLKGKKARNPKIIWKA